MSLLDRSVPVLPDDYTIPSSGDNFYVGKIDGTATVRIISSFVVGYSYYTEAGGIVRSRSEFTATPGIKFKFGSKEERDKPKYIWAFLLYNYKTKKIEMCELDKRDLHRKLDNLMKGKWGDPRGYDVTITKTGTGTDTRYDINPELPDQKLGTAYPQEVIEAIKKYEASSNPRLPEDLFKNDPNATLGVSSENSASALVADLEADATLSPKQLCDKYGIKSFATALDWARAFTGQKLPLEETKELFEKENIDPETGKPKINPQTGKTTPITALLIKWAQQNPKTPEEPGKEDLEIEDEEVLEEEADPDDIPF